MKTRLGTLAILSAVFLALMAAPASADPVGPTNYRSVVNLVEPHPTGVLVTVVGGDGFLAIAVAPGHTVDIPGYFGEPYLRVEADGTILRNERSPARFINRDRYGTTGIPDEADATAAPDWREIGSGGSFAWHDHRIHWMSPDLPPTVRGDRAEIVFPWYLDMTIDGVESEVRGELLWFPSVNPIGPMLFGAVAILLFLGRRAGRLRPTPMIAAGVGALVLLVAIAQFAATPAADRGVPLVALLPTLAIVLAVGALWIGGSERAVWILLGTSGLALIAWAVTAASVLTAPILPSALPTFLERATVSLAAWTGVGVLIVVALELSTKSGEDLDHDRRTTVSV